jgi:hypothetical protein
MSSWPTSEFIRVIKGNRKYYGPIDPVYAFRCQGGSYLLLTDGPDEGHLSEERGDRIDSWEDAVPVPTTSLTKLRDAFRGVAAGSSGMEVGRLSSVLEVISHLPADKPSPLDRAVSRVKVLLRTPVLAPDAPSEKYLARLLGALATLQGAAPDLRPQVLVTVVQICVEWIAEVTPPEGLFSDPAEALSEVQARVESDPAVGGFPAMVALSGDSATWVDEAQNTEEGLRRLATGLVDPVLTLAHYALALLAECLEGDE